MRPNGRGGQIDVRGQVMRGSPPDPGSYQFAALGPDNHPVFF